MEEITMLVNEVAELFQSVRHMLLNDHLRLTGIETEKRLGEGTDTVLAADLLAERMLVPELCRLMWPGVPVLCEESENSGLSTLVPGIQLLPYKDDVKGLPDNMISVDGLDGSALYANGEFSLTAISAGLIRYGKPISGIVMMLDEGILFYASIDGLLIFKGSIPSDPCNIPKRPLKDCLIGVDDNKAVGPTFRSLVITRLMSSSETKYPLNVPSVAGGIKVLQGKLAAYVTSNARHWDIAGTAALCTAAHQVVRCLDGSPVPWDRVRMPPVVFARDEETFNHVQTQAGDYLKLRF